MKLKNIWHSLLPFFTIFLVLLQHHSLAYQFTDDINKGSFWRTFPISMKIQLSSSDARYALTEQALVEAMEEWQKNIDINIWDYRDSSEASSNNVVRWSQDFQKETGYSASSTMAITIRYATPPLLQRTEIILNGQYGGLDNLDDIKLVLMHELGHTIGLDHSQDYGSIMYRSLALGGYGPRDLSHDDVEGLNQVMVYHTTKQSEPIQLEQRKSSNPLQGAMNCGQNSQDTSTLSSNESSYQVLMRWGISMFFGLSFAVLCFAGFKTSRKVWNYLPIKFKK